MDQPIVTCPNINQLARNYLLKKQRRGLSSVEWTRLQYKKPYWYRVVFEPGFIVYSFIRPKSIRTEPSFISFYSREQTGHYGWDSDRRGMRIFHSLKIHKTYRVFPWQWEWDAYGCGIKTQAEKNEPFHIYRKQR